MFWEFNYMNILSRITRSFHPLHRSTVFGYVFIRPFFHEQDVSQGQFFKQGATGLKSEFSFS